MTEPKRRFSLIHPSLLSLARLVRMVRTSLGRSPLASHPLVTEDARKGGNRSWTLIGVLRPLIRCDLVSHPATLPRSSLALHPSSTIPTDTPPSRSRRPWGMPSP